MEKFEEHVGIVVPLGRENVDTDAIIPKQFLKGLDKIGLGPHLFDEWRYFDRGELGMNEKDRKINSSFVLNDSRYKHASIMLTGANFGCGSSREHAAWALKDYGIKVLVGTTFGEIFYNNCFKNGILIVRLDLSIITRLFEDVSKADSYRIKVDLSKCEMVDEANRVVNFEIDDFRKDCLINGLDEIDLTLKEESAIRDFEKIRLEKNPWLIRTL